MPECFSTKWATYAGNAVQHNSDRVRHPKNNEFFEAFRTGREKFVVHRDAPWDPSSPWRNGQFPPRLARIDGPKAKMRREVRKVGTLD